MVTFLLVVGVALLLIICLVPRRPPQSVEVHQVHVHVDEARHVEPHSDLPWDESEPQLTETDRRILAASKSWPFGKPSAQRKRKGR